MLHQLSGGDKGRTDTHIASIKNHYLRGLFCDGVKGMRATSKAEKPLASHMLDGHRSDFLRIRYRGRGLSARARLIVGYHPNRLTARRLANEVLLNRGIGRETGDSLRQRFLDGGTR